MVSAVIVAVLVLANLAAGYVHYGYLPYANYGPSAYGPLYPNHYNQYTAVSVQAHRSPYDYGYQVYRPQSSIKLSSNVADSPFCNPR